MVEGKTNVGCWGYDDYAQATVPQFINTEFEIVALEVGIDISLGVDTSGDLLSWG